MPNALLDNLVSNLSAFSHTPKQDKKTKQSVESFLKQFKEIQHKKTTFIEKDISTLNLLKQLIKNKSITKTSFFNDQLKPVIQISIEQFYETPAHRHLEKPCIKFEENMISHLDHYEQSLVTLKSQLVYSKQANQYPFWHHSFDNHQKNIKETPSKADKYEENFKKDSKRGKTYTLRNSSPSKKTKSQPMGENAVRDLKDKGFDDTLVPLILKHAAQAEKEEISDIHSFYYDLFQNLLLTAGITLSVSNQKIETTCIGPFCAAITLKALIASYSYRNSDGENYRVADDEEFLLEIFFTLLICSKNKGKTYEGKLDSSYYRTIDDQLQGAIQKINDYNEITSDEMDITPKSQKRTRVQMETTPESQKQDPAPMETASPAKKPSVRRGLNFDNVQPTDNINQSGPTSSQLAP